MTVEQIHEAGAKRHPKVWFGANQHAVGCLWGCGIPVDDKMKALIPLIILRVLDFSQL